MAVATKTISFDNIGASTTANYEKAVVDTIFNQRLLWRRLREKQRTFTGGDAIQVPLRYAKGNSGTYLRHKVLTPLDPELLTAASYHGANYWADVTISKTDLNQNSGPSQIVNLLEVKFDVCRDTLEDTMNVAGFGAGTAEPDLIGIQTFLPTSANTVGGISASSYPWWNNQTYDMTDIGSLTMAALQSAWGEVTDGKKRPTICVTTQAVYDVIWVLADAKQRAGVADVQALGFNNIEFNGAPIIVDKACPAGFLYMLNEDFLYLMVRKGEDMQWTPWLTGTTQPFTKTKYLSWEGQLVCSNRRYQQVCYNLV